MDSVKLFILVTLLPPQSAAAQQAVIDPNPPIGFSGDYFAGAQRVSLGVRF